ncbi:MAG: hypothetical protein CL681_23620 [Blastopirellula sp.]|nr:hypothetical protein [Blastopirellula sp.]
MSASADRRRIIVYCQHLSGAGHYVRCREIIRALSRRHAIWFVVGGRHVPGPPLDPSVQRVQLPAIHRTAEGVRPIDPSRSLASVFGDRRVTLERLIQKVQPHALIVEHFPFSKWLLRDELLEAIRVARQVTPSLHVISSVRDFPAGNEAASTPEQLQDKVVSTLNQYFDHLLVHADAQVVTLDSQFPWIHEIKVPIHYTGYVAEKLQAPSARRQANDGVQNSTLPPGRVIVSSGGLHDGTRLATRCIAAWKLLDSRGKIDGRVMEIFAGLSVEDAPYATLEKATQAGPFRLHRFSDDFLKAMSSAELSISQGGYNTTMNLLETRTRGILAPNRRTHDQVPRAQRLTELQIVDVIDPQTESAAGLADLIHARLSRPRSVHNIALDGAERTLEWIDQLEPR